MDIWKTYPSILVSYQTRDEEEEPVLFAWNGKEWLYISCDDYLAGRFFSYPPERTVVVGADEDVPPLLADGPPWCSFIVKIPVQKTAGLINSLGQAYSFDAVMWKWMAQRYNLKLVDINAPAGDVSWYDGTFVDKQNQDGTIAKVYVPPAGLATSDVDIEFLDVQRSSPLGRIPLKAAPPRTIERIDNELTEEDGDYILHQEDMETETWETPSGDFVTATAGEFEDEDFPEAVVVPAEEKDRSVFFEYTDQDIKAMNNAK